MPIATQLFAFVLALFLVALHARAQQPLPIIDMHLHAYPADANGPPPLGLCIPLSSYLPPLDPGKQVFRAVSREPRCADPIWSPLTDEAVMEQKIKVMERHNIFGVLSGRPEHVLRWKEAASHRFIPSVEFELGQNALSTDSLRRLFEDGPFAVLGEVSNQYVGIAPDDRRMAPYWLLAEKLDIPVAIHMGEGPPGVGYIGEAPFLSVEQKRDIFYNNAARFLRLSEEEIARHHGR